MKEILYNIYIDKIENKNEFQRSFLYSPLEQKHFIEWIDSVLSASYNNKVVLYYNEDDVLELIYSLYHLIIKDIRFSSFSFLLETCYDKKINLSVFNSLKEKYHSFNKGIDCFYYPNHLLMISNTIDPILIKASQKRLKEVIHQYWNMKIHSLKQDYINLKIQGLNSKSPLLNTDNFASFRSLILTSDFSWILDKDLFYGNFDYIMTNYSKETFLNLFIELDQFYIIKNNKLALESNKKMKLLTDLIFKEDYKKIINLDKNNFFHSPIITEHRNFIYSVIQNKSDFISHYVLIENSSQK